MVQSGVFHGVLQSSCVECCPSVSQRGCHIPSHTRVLGWLLECYWRTEEPLDERSEFCREGRYGARSQNGRAANVDAMIGRRVLSQWWRPPGPGSTSISRPSHSDLCFAPVACLLFESLVQPLLRFLVSGLLGCWTVLRSAMRQNTVAPRVLARTLRG